MSWECIIPEKAIEDEKADKKGAGRGIPVKKLKIEYGAEKPLILMVEKDKNAQRLADMMVQKIMQKEVLKGIYEGGT